jgi:hypothetical protein
MSNADYLAELHVAGVLARAGWNVYFPHRDQGIDFIISKQIDNELIIRPVQVKGKFPKPEKTNKARYGYVGDLTQKHREMVLAIPYFSASPTEYLPVCIAYVPENRIKRAKRGWRCEPAEFKNGQPKPRRDYARFFDEQGLRLLESRSWNDVNVPSCA